MSNRRLVRQQLAQDLRGALNSAQAVYDHKPGNISGHPAVFVLSSGSSRDKVTAAGFGAVYFLEIHNLVLYADSTAGWSEEEAEDALDLLDYELSQFMADKNNLKNDLWKSIKYLGRSVIGKVIIGGKAYQDEIIPLQVFVP
jgi:hypothetical protein